MVSMKSIRFPTWRGEENYIQKSYGILVFALLSLLAITCLPIASSLSNCLDTRECVETKLGAVAADDSRCSEVGASMLTKGGHAVDAAVATVLCSGVVNPTESSIGGGSFMIVYNASNNKIVAFDMRETAPAKATETMFGKDEVEFEGPLAMGVPGEMRGLYKAHKMFGRLKWSTLFEPAINYAKNGFEVYPYLAQYTRAHEKQIRADPGLRKLLITRNGLAREGDMIYNKDLANTLEKLADDVNGPDDFYTGEIARNLVSDLTDESLGEKKGILTIDDLRNYKVDTPNVITVDFFGYQLVGMPPPSSGTVGLGMVANVLRNYGNTLEKLKESLGGDLGIHRFTEAMKHVLAIRMNLGDPKFVDNHKVIHNMTTNMVFGKDIWNKIKDDRTFPADYYQSKWTQIEDHGTCHQSIVDEDRNAVSITTSINAHFGAKFLSPKTGIIINNQIGDFSFTKDKNHPNRAQPGKKPLSSMTPLIIFKDGKFVGVVGGTGGRNIIAAVTQTVLRHFVFGLPPHTAVHTARVYPKVDKTDLDYEDEFTYTGEEIELTNETCDYLLKKGHFLRRSKYLAYCHFIVKTSESSPNDGGSIIAAVSDIRKGSMPWAQEKLTRYATS